MSEEVVEFKRLLEWLRSLRVAADSRVMSDWHRVGVDEISLLFSSPEELMDFVQSAKRNGMEHFNSASDHVKATVPALGREYSYRVQYEFLRVVPEEWRIEAMALLDGSSPLHEDFLETHGPGAPVHVSFKCATLAKYEDIVAQMKAQGWVQAMACVSMYGKFSYWQHVDWPVWSYMKPRVNLRDMGTP